MYKDQEHGICNFDGNHRRIEDQELYKHILKLRNNREPLSPEVLVSPFFLGQGPDNSPGCLVPVLLSKERSTRDGTRIAHVAQELTVDQAKGFYALVHPRNEEPIVDGSVTAAAIFAAALEVMESMSLGALYITICRNVQPDTYINDAKRSLAQAPGTTV